MDELNNFNDSVSTNDDSWSDSGSSGSYSIVLYIVTALMAAAGAYVAWRYVSGGRDFGFDIEWRFWKSPILWPALSFIGFFLQFIDWQHTSFKEGWVVKDSWGREKFVENNDILSVLFGSCLFPLLMHFLFIPAMYGAFLYYVIIIPLALVNALIPYLAAALAVGIAIVFFLMARNYDDRSHPYIWLIGTAIVSAVFIGLLYLPTSDIEIFKSEKTVTEPSGPTAIGYTEVTVEKANLRMGPGTDYDFYKLSDGNKLQAQRGERLEVIADQGEWYQIMTADGGTAYIKKTICSDMVTYAAAEASDQPEEIFCDAGEEEEEVTEPQVMEEVEPEVIEEVTEEEVQTSEEVNAAISAVMQTEAEVTNTASTDEEPILTIVEENAQFPGGDEACYRWLAEHIQYPAIAKEQGIQGRVFTTFVVNTDGSITDVKAERSPDPSLSEEAIRVIKMMPRWKPAHQDGKVVRSRFSLPIMFKTQ